MSHGGPAFPVPEIHMTGPSRPVANGGITIRDYFAAAALQGILAAGDIKAQYVGLGDIAYAAADNMLAAREK